jgi:hypothetical protein
MRAAANRAAAMPKFQFNRIKTMKETKPFNLEHAKAGAPYMCRNGQEATIIKWDGRDSGYPLIGVRGIQDMPGAWNVRGAWLQSESEDVYDLVMTPLGHINGKPVFVGDKLVVRGCTNEYIASPRDINALHNLAWPAPPRVYPETKMRAFDLHAAYIKARGGADEGHTAVANAALCHAIDNGQVITMEDHADKLEEIGRKVAAITSPDLSGFAQELRWQESIMEIAKAVHDACLNSVSAFSQDGMRLTDIKLKRIIAKVST